MDVCNATSSNLHLCFDGKSSEDVTVGLIKKVLAHVAVFIISPNISLTLLRKIVINKLNDSGAGFQKITER